MKSSQSNPMQPKGVYSLFHTQNTNLFHRRWILGGKKVYPSRKFNNSSSLKMFPLSCQSKLNLLEASNFCLSSAISASAAASLCWDMASASFAVFTRNSKLCSSREDFKVWTWAHALYSKSLASMTSLQIL